MLRRRSDYILSKSSIFVAIVVFEPSKMSNELHFWFPFPKGQNAETE